MLGAWKKLGLGLSILALSIEGRADVAILSGRGSTGISSDAPFFPVIQTFTVGENVVTSLPIPNSSQGEILGFAIDSYRGTVIYVGDDDNNVALIYRGSVASDRLKQIFLPIDNDLNPLDAVAIDSTGTAVLGGGNFTSNAPVIFTLPAGGSTPISIGIPGSLQGFFDTAGVFPNDVAILAGQDTITNAPLIFVLAPGGDQAVQIPLPSPITGVIYNIAVGSNGTALLVGQDLTNNQPLIYSLAQNSSTAQSVSIPSEDLGMGGIINQAAIGPNGAAILVGSSGTPQTPLIYSLSPNSLSASRITNANMSDEGELLAVAIASDNTAVLGGHTSATDPLIYRVRPNSSQADSISPPPSPNGTISSIAMSSDNTAILVGSFSTETNQSLIFSLPLHASSASTIFTSTPFIDISIGKVAIYLSDGPYDPRKLRPHYYLQLYDTQTLLNGTGL